MSETGQSLLTSATNLRAALEASGDALASVDLDAMLGAEIALAAALAVLPSERGAVKGQRDLVLQELVRARTALTRCRRLGGALAAIARTSLGAQGVVADCYGADGRYAGAPSRGLEAKG